MNQQCKVCGEPAAGFHFGAFTCEGCKSFFGRTYNNISSISECKNNGECVINKKNRTACKACRLRKCLLVGMSKSGSRYGRRSNWFKIHCLLQEQQQQHNSITSQHLQQQQHQQQQQPQHHHQQSTQINHHIHHPNQQNNNKSPSLKTALNPFLSVGHFLNGSLCADKKSSPEADHRLSSPSDSGASSADLEDRNSVLSIRDHRVLFDSSPPITDRTFSNSQLATKLDTIRSLSEPIKSFLALPNITISSSSSHSIPSSSIVPLHIQDEPIDLSFKSRKRCRTTSPKPNPLDGVPKLTPLDLTLVRSDPLSG